MQTETHRAAAILLAALALGGCGAAPQQEPAELKQARAMLKLGKPDIAARLLREAEARGADPEAVAELAARIDEQRGPVDTSPWADPLRLCGLLRRVGLDSRGWRADELGGHCASDYREFGPPGPRGLPTNAAYYVEGPDRSRAATVTLVLSVHNPATLGDGLRLVANATEVLFALTSLEPPARLRERILAAEPFEETIAGARVSLRRQRDRIDTWRLEIEDAGASP